MTMPSASIRRYLFISLLYTTILLSLLSKTLSQTWEESNDPQNLCMNSHTGYKATRDCRGYVYCNEGYLMGGDVIPCWPNQLFDEEDAVCTTWQSVTEKLGDDMEWRCPDYDGTLMEPEDKDGNANPQLFFCGSSTFNAKSVCEPCPGGIRTECSNPSHNCYAGITGCPVQPAVNNPPPTTSGSPPVSTSNPPPSPSGTSTPGNPATADALVQVAISNPTPNPTPQPVDIEIIIADPNESGDRTDSFYLHGKLRTSYYCGFSWDLVIKTCTLAHPCPSGLNTECPLGQTCFPETPCHEQRTPPPSTKPTGKPTTLSQAKNYCGPDWEWVVANCANAIPCPYGDANGVCPPDYKCIADTPCDQFDIVGPNSSKPTPNPTKNPTFPPVEGDDPNKRYCGHNWADVTENCLTAIPCPGGVAFGVCPDDMNCIAETPCNDEEYLDWLRDKQAKIAAEQGEVQTPSELTDEGNDYCMNDDDCDSKLMCNNGYCSQCLNDGTGCSSEEICKPATCGEPQNSGPSQCFAVSELDSVCRAKLNDPSAICAIGIMACEATTTSSESSGLLAAYENPGDNAFFCGDDYYAILESCLQSKPCPGGFAAGVCDSGEGCFSVVACRSEYSSALYDAITNPSPVTNSPTMNPTQKPTVEVTTSIATNNPTKNPTQKPTVEVTTSIATNNPANVSSENTANTNTIGSTNYCGVSWSSHAENCDLATPCPRGDECSPGETCFSDSPCAAADNNNPAADSAMHICGSDWNTLITTCKTATTCPKGTECPKGTMCYRNFECDPPQSSASNEDIAAALEASMKNGTTEIIVNEHDVINHPEEEPDAQLSIESASNGDTVIQSTTTSTTSKVIDAVDEETKIETGDSQSVVMQDESTNSLATEGDLATDAKNTADNAVVAPTSLDICNICGSAGQFDYNSFVTYEGFEVEMACGELIWVFANNNVYEGSSECLASRAKYFNACCYNTPKNSCDICPEQWTFYLEKTTLFNGYQSECSRVGAHFSTKYEMNSEECKEAKTSHSYDCCFEPCTLCGDQQSNWEASVYFSGEDIRCNEFDIMFREEGIIHDSSRCQMTQDLYSGDCCIPSLGTPCDICQTEKFDKHLKTGETPVSYEGAMTTCLNVYTKLFSTVEQDTEMCSRAQKALLDQCCEHLDENLDGNPAETSFDRTPVVIDNSPTPMPAPTEDVLSAQWYAGSLDRSPSSTSAILSTKGLIITSSYVFFLFLGLL